MVNEFFKLFNEINIALQVITIEYKLWKINQ